MSNRSFVDRVRGAGMRAMLAGMALSSAGLAGSPPTLRGDLNCDGFITIADISPFVLLLLDPVGYAGAFPECDPASGDTNQDGFVTVGDIGSFVALLAEPAGPLFPNPLYRHQGDIKLYDVDGDGVLDAVFGDVDPISSAPSIGVRFGTVNGEFLNPRITPTTNFLGAFVVADFDGDGRPDVGSANPRGPSVNVLLGGVAGSFTPAGDFGVGDGALDIGAADFNGDGVVDLVTTNPWTMDASILIGAGDGTFLPETRVPLGLTTFSLAVADMDLDGDADIVVNGDALVLLQNHGDGTFQVRPTGLPLGFPQISIAVGDINQDGFPDIANVVDFFYAVQIALGDGAGNFSILPKTLFLPEFNNDIELGDTDGDGDLDLLVPIFEPYGLITFRNLGDGQFGDAESTPGPASSLECTTGDIEGDGDLDVVILGLGFCPLLNRGDGTFDTRRLFAQGEVFGSTILADLDLDSDLDILTADAFSQEPVTLLGNGDGTFGPLTPAGQSAPAAYYPFVFDATSDGIPDLIGLGENTIIALPGLGDGTFGTPVLSPTAFAQHAPFWGDFNLDGHLDLFLLAPFALVPPPSIVLFGDGAGGFVEGPSMQWAGVGLAFADFNEDGILDSAIRLISPPGIQVRLGVGNGTFGPPSTVTPSIGPSVPETIFVADYDKDGHVDLLASVSSNGAGIVVIPGDGDGTFGAPVASPAAIAGAPADFDLDGNLDLFVFTAGGFGICFGDGAGNFSAPAVFAASSLISSATTPLGDIDGDGDVDIVGLDSFQLGLQVIKNRRYR